MRLIHNSRLPQFRTPFGAVTTGTTVALSVILEDADPNQATLTLRTWVDEVGETLIPMEHEGDGIFTGELKCDEPCLVWYSFICNIEGQPEVRLGAPQGRTGGEGVTYDYAEVPSFQITVYKHRENRPTWYERGMVYQIFPDRYARDEHWRERTMAQLEKPRKGIQRRMVEDWNEPPVYERAEDGSIKTYDPKEYNLDNVNQGKNLFILYDIYGDEKYRKAIDTIRSQLLTQPRTKEGNFWHKDIYPWQVWLDGTYMAQPFYMEYETRFNKMQGCIDSYKQFMNIKKHMRDEKTGLYYHGYDESRQMYWADPETGCSPNFWLRAMGWFLVAMVDVLERMDEQLYNEYRGIMAMLKQTVEDMHKFQDEQTGMFWQVIDHPEAEGNYLETSGTALFAYAVLKGVRLGYLPKRMAAWAEKAFYGTCDRYLSKNPDGSLQLDGICLVAGLGGKDHRDGSLAYYFSEPVVCNDAKGVGPLVLAYTEMIARK